jgi:hypothetical protein
MNLSLNLADKLEEKFKVKFPIFRKNKDQFIIKTSTIPAELFLKDIQNDIIKVGMFRKYNKWKDFDLNYIPKIGRPKIKITS